MDQLAPIGRRMFAIAIIAFGLLQFVFGDFVPGRAPAWPAALPGRLVWAYASGAVFVVAGAAVLLEQRAREAAMLIGALIGVWALLRHVPLALADVDFGTPWTAAGKALALTGGAFAVGSTSSERRMPSDLFLVAGSCCLGIFFVNSGIQHFLFAGGVSRLVPVWIPGALVWVYVAGVGLIAGGIGLIIPKTRRLAAVLTGAMVFTWLIILHIPRATAAVPAQRRNEWTAVFEALAFAGIAFVLTTSRRARK